MVIQRSRSVFVSLLSTLYSNEYFDQDKILLVLYKTRNVKKLEM